MGIALGIVLLEAYLTLLSRHTKGSKFPLRRDDATWWIEWVVAATAALITFLIVNSQDHKSVSTVQIVAAVVALFAGYSALPALANNYCVENGHVKSTGWLVFLNILGILILGAAVAVGAKIYE